MLTYKRIKVVNIKKEECTHYCGRLTSYRGNGKNCSALGNPFPVNEQRDRDTSIAMYAEHFPEILRSPEAMEAIRCINEDAETMDIKLGCFCKPKSCHCDIIAQHFMNAWTTDK